MSQVDRQRVKEIFAEAIELPADKREDFVEVACRGEPLLRAEVDRMLRLHSGVDDFLANPTAAFTAATAEPTGEARAGESVGDIIGRYKLLQLIGEGGFGSVYMAEQREPVQRQVALKVIKLGMDTKQVIARFEAERQALAMMDHPNIARVLDAGATESGRPYFVMDLVRGVPITQYCDQNNLSTRERLDLFTAVCSAVQHAHQKGIIHRDIKPSNVMVTLRDGKPVPKVIDFGIAKATSQRLTEKTLFTEYRQFIGTPQYMSPEQAGMSELDVDTRSDIYSLGVLLYELLTGTTPFDPARLRSAALGEIQRIIREEEPPRPSTRISTLGDAQADVARRRQSEPEALRRRVRGDLDWIVMKSLEKDRTRRYESASALAEDVRRHLSDEPVAAGPPSRVYRLRKLIRRNKAPVAMAGTVIVAIVAGLVLMSIGFVRAERQRDAAIASQQAEQMQRRKAEQAHADAMAVLRFFTDTLSSADPNVQGHQVTVREALDRAGETIGEQFKDRPYIEGQVRAQLALTYMNLGLRDAAVQQLPRAVEIYREVTGASSQATIDLELELAKLYADLARYEEARKLTENARAAVAARRGADDPGILKTMNLLTSIDWAVGDLQQAEALCRETLEGRRRVLGPDHPDTLRSLRMLGILYDVQGRPAEAEPLFREAFEGSRTLRGFEHPDTLDAANSLALALSRLDRREEASDLYERALEAWKRIGGIDHPKTLVTMSNLAETYASLERFDEATRLYDDVLPRKERVLGPDHPSTLRTVADMAVMDHRRGNFERAAELWARVNHTAPRAFPEDHPIIARFLDHSAETLIKLEQFAQAETNLLEAHRRLSATLGGSDKRTLAQARRLVTVYEAWDKPDAAAQWRARLAKHEPRKSGGDLADDRPATGEADLRRGD